MNFKYILYIILIILLLLVFTKYNIVTSSPELLEAVKYKDNSIIEETHLKIKEIREKAKVDYIEEQFTNFKASKDSKESSPNISVMLFFSQSCTHCHKFYPIWKHVTGSMLESHIHNTEIECEKDKSMCKQYNIETVPTVIVFVNGKETRLKDKMDETSFASKLAECGVPMKKLNVAEGFVDYISAAQVEAEGDSRKTTDPDCPYMSFYEGDPNNYCADSNYLFGCINASPGSGIDAFDGAFGVVTSYINSLPVTGIDKKKKCMAKYGHIVKAWNLCNPLRLMEKRNYSQDIDMNLSKPRFLHVNYNDNKDAVDAINYACGLN